MAELPDYITEGDGFVDVTLARPAMIAGVKQSVVRMREPTVNDQIAAKRSGNNDGVQEEIFLIAHLAQTAPDDLKAMIYRNYKRLQVALLSFID